MKKYWKTKEGKEIEYSKLEDSHLLNILGFIERAAEEGITIMSGGGIDFEDFWFDEEEIYGAEVKQRFDYRGLRKEARNRGLLKELIK
jgi:hypothetical protein